MTYALAGGNAAGRVFDKRASSIDLTWAGIRPSDDVLDVGCGRGALTLRMAELACHGSVTGVDRCRAAIETARRKIATDVPSRIHFTTAEAEALPFGAETYDVVCFHTVLMHLQEPVRALREFVRVTRKNGRVVALGEGDWSYVRFRPPCWQLEQLVDGMIVNLRRHGGDPYLGKRLAKIFRAAGLTDTEVAEAPGSRAPISGRDMAEAGYLDMAASLLREQAVAGISSDAQVKTLLAPVRRWCRRQDSVFFTPGSFRARAPRV